MIGLRKAILRVFAGALTALAATQASAATYTANTVADLTSRLTATVMGDVIVLPAGNTYVGTFTLPNKTPGTPPNDYITIRTSAVASLPASGTRVNLSHASLMPKIIAPNLGSSAIKTAVSAHHYKLIGVEVITFASTPTQLMTNDLIELGSGLNTAETQEPRYITIDRCIVRANDSNTQIKRGIALNGRYIDVLDSHVAGFKTRGQPESQAIGGWNGHGPFNIINNYIEGAGENVMFGGTDPDIDQLVPGDIVVQKNHFFKPRSWNPWDSANYIPPPTGLSTPFLVKNLFELKNARNVLVEGNIFENNWANGQDGTAILFTVRNQENSAPWAVVENVTFRKNIVRHTNSGFNTLGQDDTNPSDIADNINIENNLIYDVGNAPWYRDFGIGGHLYKLLGRSNAMMFNHNTSFHLRNVGVISSFGGNAADQHTNFKFINNLQAHNTNGFFGDTKGFGNPALDWFFLNAMFTKNVLTGGPSGSYSSYPGNYFPSSWTGVVTNFNGGLPLSETNFSNFKVASNSAYVAAGVTTAGAPDGKDIGCNIDEVTAATAGCISGVWGVSTVAAPSFSPAPGTYSSTQNVTISTSTAGASIRYTTNGTTPTSTTGTLYTAPVSIPSTTTLKAIAYKTGMTDSTVTTGVYTINVTTTTKVLKHNVNGYTGASSFHVQNTASTHNVHTGYPNSVFYHPVNQLPVTNTSMIRPFYRFDLSQAGNAIPANAVIDSATLKIKIDAVSGSGVNDIYIHRVVPTTGFTVNYSTATHDTYNGTNQWSGGMNAGGEVGDANNDFLDTPDDTEQLPTSVLASPPNPATYLTFTVTSSVQAWVNGAPNNGWLFRTAARSASLSSTIDSGSGGSAEYAELTITYH